MTKKILLLISVLIVLALTVAICSDINSSTIPAHFEAPTPTPTLQVQATPTPTPTPTLETSTPSPTPETPTPTPAPTPTPTPTPFSNGLIVAIDPGHQAVGNYNLEPVGPGATTQKAKVASGTRGVSTGVPEYRLNLDISLQLRDELIERGYTVVMIRETNDVNISNAERAKLATDAGADIFVRVHANGNENSSVRGMLMISTSRNNPFVSHLYADNRALSEAILEAMVAETGANNRGIVEMDDMSGSNWSTIPVTIIEMGFMTNAAEDELMQTADYQHKIVIGIANGIDNYFE